MRGKVGFYFSNYLSSFVISTMCIPFRYTFRLVGSDTNGSLNGRYGNTKLINDMVLE